MSRLYKGNVFPANQKITGFTYCHNFGVAFGICTASVTEKMQFLDNFSNFLYD